MSRLPSSSATSARPLSFWAGLGWMQLAFAVASCLLGWSVTGYTNFWWSLVFAASMFAFIAGNIVILPLYGALHAWRGGGFLYLCLAFGLGAPLASLMVSVVNKSAAQGYVIDPETGQPIDLFDDAFAWSMLGDLAHTSAIAVVSVLIVWALRIALQRLLPPRRGSAE